MKMDSLNVCKIPCFLLAALSFLMVSCTQQKDIKDQMDPRHTICYTAIDGTDTAWLSLDTSARHLVLGQLRFNYNNDKHYQGQFKGALKGDTLKGHYDFKLNKIDKWYRNPVAFLKTEGGFVMGVGDIRLIWGSPFFDQDKPIDYNKGRFMFKQVDCTVK